MVCLWHLCDIEAARSNVRFSALFATEGAQLHRRCSPKNMSTFETGEHLQEMWTAFAPWSEPDARHADALGL